jgi:hypothetical protein
LQYDVQCLSADVNISSIFTDTSVRRIDDAANTHVFNSAGSSGVGHLAAYHVTAAASHITSDGGAVFAMALQTNGLLVIRMPPFGSRGTNVSFLLCQKSAILSYFVGLTQVDCYFYADLFVNESAYCYGHVCACVCVCV